MSETVVNKHVQRNQQLCKSVKTCLDSSKKDKRVQTKSKVSHVVKLHDNVLMDDVIVGPTVNAEFSFKPLTAETASCKSGKKSSVTQVSPTRATKQSKCVGDIGKQTRVGKPATMQIG